MTFKEKSTNKSVYVVPPLAVLIKIRSLGAPILFFASWCTQNLISLTTTALLHTCVQEIYFGVHETFLVHKIYFGVHES